MNDEIKEILDNLKNKDNDIKGINFLKYQDLTRGEITLLLDYITNLQQKIEQYENPDDMTLFYMWLDAKAKDKIKELQQENERLKVDEHFFTECGFTNIEQLALCYLGYKSRCEKAIEYIKEAIENDDYFEDDIATDIKESSYDKYVNSNSLLNILQNGSDKE